MGTTDGRAASQDRKLSAFPILEAGRPLGVITIREAQRFLARYFLPTRLVSAPFLSQATGRNVYLKLEAELPTGSFKVPGAFWALAQRMSSEPIREGVACSTGNHGAAAGHLATTP